MDQTVVDRVLALLEESDPQMQDAILLVAQVIVSRSGWGDLARSLAAFIEARQAVALPN